MAIEKGKQFEYESLSRRSWYYTDLLWKNLLAYGADCAGLTKLEKDPVTSAVALAFFGGCTLLIILAWLQVTNVMLSRKTVTKMQNINTEDFLFCCFMDPYAWISMVMAAAPILIWHFALPNALRGLANEVLPVRGGVIILGLVVWIGFQACSLHCKLYDD